MFFLTNEQIVKQASLNNFTKGKELYNKGLFKYEDIKVTTQKTDSSITVFTAHFTEHELEREAFLRIHNTYGILYYDCDCNSFTGF